MINVHDLSDDAARHAIEHGEFPGSILDGQRVAVIMTQHWCPDWYWMKSWLDRESKSPDPDGPDMDVYVFLYDKVPYFREFMKHKETVFGNRLIPYVRYYRDGEIVGESNQLGKERFVSMFGVRTGSRAR
jgi:hypothetical protein